MNFEDHLRVRSHYLMHFFFEIDIFRQAIEFFQSVNEQATANSSSVARSRAREQCFGRGKQRYKLT